jgi:hypothetical protein
VRCGRGGEGEERREGGGTRKCLRVVFSRPTVPKCQSGPPTQEGWKEKVKHKRTNECGSDE